MFNQFMLRSQGSNMTLFFPLPIFVLYVCYGMRISIMCDEPSHYFCFPNDLKAVFAKYRWDFDEVDAKSHIGGVPLF